MYQALYRTWRPKTFDEVVGQEHITHTLKRQVSTGRLSHAYLFTGTRGTGKTTCAKLLARAVNCEHPVDGNPCNACASCLGIENGSILDVLELDAASNNRVDDIRAILDEAAYTPATVKKRVYIVDEVHMLSTQAFNALLQILEEPPEHLMFILATTEIHKVPATIKSRCQQFSFKRIHADAIAARLSYVAGQEQLNLTQEGAALIARLSDGGMRDALSLLDQCIGDHAQIGETEILEALGLAGNVDTADLMEHLARGEVEEALGLLDRLYAAGKEMAALLGELSALARDLLIRRTAPRTGASLMTGGFDSATLNHLSGLLDTPRLLQMLSQLQRAAADITRSANRRTDTELCLVTLCDPSLDGSAAGLSARVARLEEQMRSGVPAAPAGKPEETKPAAPRKEEPAISDDLPPWAEQTPEPQVPDRKAPKASAPAESAADAAAPAVSWDALRARLERVMNVADFCFVGNPAMVTGSVEGDTVTLWADTEFVKGFIDKPEILTVVANEAQTLMGRPVHAVVRVGQAPAQPAPSAAPAPEAHDALDDLLGLDNVTMT